MIIQRNKAKLGEQGASLLEVLVALFVLTIGVLGVLAMFSSSFASQYAAFHRSQAIFYAQDLIDRTRAWQHALSEYELSPTDAVCRPPESTIDTAKDDRDAWLAALGCSLPNSEAEVRLDLTQQRIEVEITWRSGLLQRASSVELVTQL